MVPQGMLEEPYASIAHVRFREGRRQQCQPSTRPFVLPPQALHRFMREICLGTIRQRKAAGGWALERDAVGCVNPECFGRRHSHAPVWKTGRRQQTRPFVSCAIRQKNRPLVFRMPHPLFVFSFFTPCITARIMKSPLAF